MSTKTSRGGEIFRPVAVVVLDVVVVVRGRVGGTPTFGGNVGSGTVMDGSGTDGTVTPPPPTSVALVGCFDPANVCTVVG